MTEESANNHAPVESAERQRQRLTRENEVRSRRETAGPRRRYTRRPRLCQFCAEKTKYIDHKQTDLLKRFINDQGKIRPRRDTGTCSRHQRMVSRAIKRARHLALLPFVIDRLPR